MLIFFLMMVSFVGPVLLTAVYPLLAYLCKTLEVTNGDEGNTARRAQAAFNSRILVSHIGSLIRTTNFAFTCTRCYKTMVAEASCKKGLEGWDTSHSGIFTDGGLSS